MTRTVRDVRNVPSAQVIHRLLSGWTFINPAYQLAGL
jgi:hypothetical protein